MLLRLDNAEDGRERQDRGDRRKCHSAGAGATLAPSRIGGLVQVLRHVEERRKKKMIIVADAPHAEQHERRLRPGRSS